MLKQIAFVLDKWEELDQLIKCYKADIDLLESKNKKIRKEIKKLKEENQYLQHKVKKLQDHSEYDWY